MQQRYCYVFATIIIFSAQHEAILVECVHCWRISLLNVVLGVSTVVILSATVVAVDSSAAMVVEGELDGGSAIPCGSRDGTCQGEFAIAGVGTRDADMFVGLQRLWATICKTGGLGARCELYANGGIVGGRQHVQLIVSNLPRRAVVLFCQRNCLLGAGGAVVAV